MKEALVFHLYMRCVEYQILNMFSNPSRLIFSPSNPIRGTGFPIKSEANLCRISLKLRKVAAVRCFETCSQALSCSQRCCMRIPLHHNNTRGSCQVTWVCMLCTPRARPPHFSLYLGAGCSVLQALPTPTVVYI